MNHQCCSYRPVTSRHFLLPKKEFNRPTKGRGFFFKKAHTHNRYTHKREGRRTKKNVTKNATNDTERKSTRGGGAGEEEDRSERTQERQEWNKRTKKKNDQISIKKGHWKKSFSARFFASFCSLLSFRQQKKSMSFVLSICFLFFFILWIFLFLSLCTTSINSKFAIFQKFVFKHKIFTLSCLPSFIIEENIGALNDEVTSTVFVNEQLLVRNHRWSLWVLHAVGTTSCASYGNAMIVVSVLWQLDTEHAFPRKTKIGVRCTTFVSRRSIYLHVVENKE